MELSRFISCQWDSIIQKIRCEDKNYANADVVIGYDSIWINPSSKHYELLTKHPYEMIHLQSDPFVFCRWLEMQALDFITISDSGREVVAIYILF